LAHLLHELFGPGLIMPNLAATTRDEALTEMVAGLDLSPGDRTELMGVLAAREAQGTTGVGEGIAIPHARSRVIKRLAMVYGRKQSGLDWNAMDGEPVRHVFLILSPPIQVSNEYLPVMGNVARLVRQPEVRKSLDDLDTPQAFSRLLEEHGF